MAKDLPYFKFFVSEWNDGDITLEEYKIQGLFINICSYYWSNECVLNKKRLYKRFKNDIKDIEYLIEEGFIKLCDDYVNISFLNEQKEDNKDRSAKNSNSGKISAMKREINNIISFIKENSNEDLTSVEKLLNEKPTSVKKLLNIKSTIKIREDKIREEKIKKDYKEKPTKEVDFSQIDIWINELKNEHTFIEGLYRIHKFKQGSVKDLALMFKEHLKMFPTIHKDFTSFRNHLASWINLKAKNNELNKFKKHVKGDL